MRVHGAIIEIVVSLRIGAEAWVIFGGCEDKWSAASPPPHKLGRYQLLLFWRLAMLTEKIAKRAYVFFHPEIGNIATIVRENLRLRQPDGRAILIGITKKEFPWFNRRTGARCRLYTRSFDDWLREPVAVAEVFVSVVKRGDRLQIQRGEKFHSLAFRHISFMFLLAPLTFNNVACKQYGDGMQVWTCQVPNPVIRVIRAGGGEHVRSRRHPLTKLLRKSG
jgi:hypothetical protein